MLISRLSTIFYGFARKTKPVIPNAVTQIIEKNKNQAPSMFASHNNKINIETKQENQLSPQYLQYESDLKNKIKDKVVQQLKYNPSFEGQDPNPTKLVNRPSKGAVWGLGGQLIMANRRVQLQGVKDDMEQIIQFLQLNQVKNLYVHDFHKQNPDRPQTNKKRFHLLGSCYSSRHCWKVATQLKNAFNLYSGKSALRRRSKKYDPIYATRNGGKDQQFSMVQYKDFSINLMTQQQRQAMDLEWKWNNEVPQQTIDKYTRANQNRKGRKNQFQDF